MKGLGGEPPQGLHGSRQVIPGEQMLQVAIMLQ